jgi:hypothetical protein
MAKLGDAERRKLERKLVEYARRGDKDKITYAKAMLGEARVAAILGESLQASMPNRITVQYVGQKEFNKDEKAWLRNGYHIASINEVKQPVGVGRLATIGIGALVIEPKPHIYVTYERD